MSFNGSLPCVCTYIHRSRSHEKYPYSSFEQVASWGLLAEGSLFPDPLVPHEVELKVRPVSVCPGYSVSDTGGVTETSPSDIPTSVRRWMVGGRILVRLGVAAFLDSKGPQDLT